LVERCFLQKVKNVGSLTIISFNGCKNASLRLNTEIGYGDAKFMSHERCLESALSRQFFTEVKHSSCDTSRCVELENCVFEFIS